MMADENGERLDGLGKSDGISLDASQLESETTV
jgi:hypothetical protein